MRRRLQEPLRTGTPALVPAGLEHSMTWAEISRGLRVGTDIVRVAEVREAVATFGDRYLSRVFTARELAEAGRNAADMAPRLAARFAAKEAVLKVLRPEGWWPDWRDIEVQRAAGGWCAVALHGRAAALADAHGVTVSAVSLSHEDDIATAVAVGIAPHDAATRGAACFRESASHA